MSANQLPENMGKKIVEALKRQALYEDENISAHQESFSEPEDFATTTSVEQIQVDEPQINEIKEDEDINLQSQPQIQSQLQNQSQLHQQFNSVVNETPLQFSVSGNTQNVSYNSYSPELPTNVAVLKKLISQLPAGVSKQVGAQIIRQTIEALGISMNSVLQEAQQVQETLNNAVTDCSIKMQEYKNQIMQLEANARDYQRQMAQINDLISLFILTDNKK